MAGVMNQQNLRSFAYSNDHLIESGAFRGIVVDFQGLGYSSMQNEDGEWDRKLAAQGIVRIVPYYNPWSWMNSQAAAYTDEIIGVLAEKFGKQPKIVSSGGSMGGLCALVYCRYSAHRDGIVSCVTNCPVCDLPYHYTERPDLPRTLYSAFGFAGTAVTEADLAEALRAHSPLHLAQAGEMPDIDYHDFHCEADGAVNLERHSLPFVETMRKQGRRITFDQVPGRGHCDLTTEMWEKYGEYQTAPLL